MKVFGSRSECGRHENAGKAVRCILLLLLLLLPQIEREETSSPGSACKWQRGGCSSTIEMFRESNVYQIIWRP